MEEAINWISTIRDLGIIIGVPTIGLLLVRYYNQQINILKSQIAAVKETQYDKALSQIKAQKEIFELERKELEKIKNELFEKNKEAEDSYKKYYEIATRNSIELKRANEELENLKAFDDFVYSTNKYNSDLRDFFLDFFKERDRFHQSIAEGEQNWTEDEKDLIDKLWRLNKIGVCFLDNGFLAGRDWSGILTDISEKGILIRRFLRKIRDDKNDNENIKTKHNRVDG